MAAREAGTFRIENGMEVYTPRGHGRVVARFYGDDNWPTPPFYIVELEDDGGRTVVAASAMQVVDRSGT